MSLTPPTNAGPTLSRLYGMPRADAVRLLETNYEVFCNAVEEVYASSPLPPVQPTSDTPTDRAIAMMAQQLRETGFTAYRGYFRDPAALEAARGVSRWVRERADHFGITTEDVFDQENDALLWKRLLPTASRASFRMTSLPPGLQPFASDPLIEKVMQLAIHNDQFHIAPALMVVDNMMPTDVHEFQWWHYDRLRDQFKMMILLDDVTPDKGPMKIVPGTHRFHPERRIMDFGMYAAGLDYGDVSFTLYNRLKDRTVELTGKAGDIFIFDTRAFHAHGRVKNGERMTATLYFNSLDTAPNRFWNDFTPDRVI